jgi:hypothetical protein
MHDRLCMLQCHFANRTVYRRPNPSAALRDTDRGVRAKWPNPVALPLLHAAGAIYRRDRH